MKFLVDTNVVSELYRIRSGRACAEVVAWAASVPPTDAAISAITVFELELGVLRIERRDPAQGQSLRSWLEHIGSGFAGRVFAVDDRVARRAAALHVPNPRPERDSLIAATAMVHGLTVVTRNVRDFEPMGVPLLNPWESVQ